MKYNSTVNRKSQYAFCQTEPRYTCANATAMLERNRELVEARKIDFIFCCRRVRCSIECNLKYHAKLAACRARLLSEYIELPVYRGNLAMPLNAPPADHKRT